MARHNQYIVSKNKHLQHYAYFVMLIWYAYLLLFQTLKWKPHLFFYYPALICRINIICIFYMVSHILWACIDVRNNDNTTVWHKDQQKVIIIVRSVFPYDNIIVKCVGTDYLNPIYNWVDNFTIYNSASTGSIPSLLATDIADTWLMVPQIYLYKNLPSWN